MTFYQRHGQTILFFIALALALFVIYPFWQTILIALIVGYACMPLYKVFHKRLKYASVASLSVLSVIFLAVALPFFIGLNFLLRQSKNLYAYFEDIEEYILQNIQIVIDAVHQYAPITFSVETVSSAIVGYIFDISQQVLLNIPGLLLQLFVFFFILYYIFKENYKVHTFIVESLPYSKEYTLKVIKRFDKVFYGVVYGQIFTAVLQGLVAGIAYWLVGVQYVWLWIIITIIAAFLPMIGTWLVWLPMGIFIIFTGFASGQWVWGVFLLVYGITVISIIDNLI
ncbi:MAG: AI-2E family transporter, partial [Candidatus Woesearchaeota archaeon]